MASEQIHASAVSISGKGCLITGDSGSGKSTLALELIALGAGLIADDRVDLSITDGNVMLSCPHRLRGIIEARGVGLISLDAVSQPAACRIVVDLDHSVERLPGLNGRDLLGISCPVIFGKDRSGLASIVHVLVQSGRLMDPEQGVAT